MIKLNNGDIVWSGAFGGASGGAFHIQFQRYTTGGGCWCPVEAVGFLRSIGIHVYETKSYDSGYGAAGCWFNSEGQRSLSPHVEEAYYKTFTNRYGSRFFLKQY